MQVTALKTLAEKNAEMMWQVEGYKNETELVKQQYETELQHRDQSVSFKHLVTRIPLGVLPCIDYMDMCRCSGYSFQTILSKTMHKSQKYLSIRGTGCNNFSPKRICLAGFCCM